jgi:PII-like signaling protein
MDSPAKMLMIFLDEAEREGDLPLYEAIVRRLSHLPVSGATVQSGIMGFGRHHRIHKKRLLGISDDRPITITVIDSEARLRAILPEIRPMVRDGLMLMLDAEVL